MDIKIYFRRPKLTELPETISVTEAGNVLSDYALKNYTSGTFELRAFDTNVFRNDLQIKVQATMLIPRYFEEVQNNELPGEIHGQFLIPIGTQEIARLFLLDLAHGSHGCPTLVVMGGSKKFFSFNNMRFYPFIMTDFTVGYYVRDTPPAGNPEWPDDYPSQKNIAIDYPIYYDATLGLYITRGARFVQ